MSLIESMEIVSGDSSDIYEFSSPDFSGFDTDPDWEGNWNIRFESITGDIAIAGLMTKETDKFIFLLDPIDSATLDPGGYFLTMEIKNLTLDYRREIVQCKLKVTTSGYDNT